MDFNGINRQLLARYLADECTDHEKQQVEEWIMANKKNKQKLNQFRKIWNVSAHRKSEEMSTSEVEVQWNQLRERLQKEGELAERDSSYKNRRRTFSLHSMTQRVMRVAAIFLIAGLIGIFAYQSGYRPEPAEKNTVLRQVHTENAQRVNLTLGDGTKVMLNAGSDMKFPDQFKGDIREVYLTGEAYFDVASNPDRPFVIHSRNAQIRVLGTAFTVRSYQEEHEVQVVVEEGKVAVSDSSATSDNKAVITANEKASYSLTGGSITTSKVDDMQLYLSWRQGYLKFKETSMAQVATALERRYGVEVAFQDSQIRDKKLTAFLKSRSIKNVLNVIAMSLDISYQLEENHITFRQSPKEYK